MQFESYFKRINWSSSSKTFWQILVYLFNLLIKADMVWIWVKVKIKPHCMRLFPNERHHPHYYVESSDTWHDEGVSDYCVQSVTNIDWYLCISSLCPRDHWGPWVWLQAPLVKRLRCDVRCEPGPYFAPLVCTRANIPLPYSVILPQVTMWASNTISIQQQIRLNVMKENLNLIPPGCSFLGKILVS